MNRDFTASTPLHVVLGAGQVGARLARLLRERGHRVRSVRRSATRTAERDIEQHSGDITDLAFAEQALAGAHVVYDCMNPQYHQWSELLLPIARGALHGATRAGARLVALDCLYMYGRPSGAMREDSPLTPCSRKGALRVQLGELRLQAHARGDLPVAIGRASDFFGANLAQSAYSDRFYQRALAGQPVECMGDPDMPHSLTYVEDVARSLALLGERSEAPGGVWHLPSLPALGTQEFNARYGRLLGLEVRTRRVPQLLLRAGGVFSPMLRELVEMTYQWELPYVLDDTKFRTTFGMDATPLEHALEQTAQWARARFQIAQAA